MNNHEVAINGVKIIAKILNIPIPYISFFDPSEVSNNEITGMYLFESDESYSMKSGLQKLNGLRL